MFAGHRLKSYSTDFKFGMHVSKDSPDMTPYKFFEKGAWPGSPKFLGVKMLIAPKRLKLRTSNLTCMFSRLVQTWPLNCFSKRAWPGPRDHLNFGWLNANSSKTVKSIDFKFDKRVSRDSRTWTLKSFRKGAWLVSRDLLNFWVQNANISKTVKATDFKFDVHVSRYSPVMTPYFLEKAASVKIHLAEICTLTSAF